MTEKLSHPMCSTRCGPGYIDYGTLCVNQSSVPGLSGAALPNPEPKIDVEELVREAVCKLAQKKGLNDITNEGGIIKFRGRLYPCFWDVGTHRSPLFKDSTLAHEKSHIKDAEKYGYTVSGLLDKLINLLSAGPANSALMRVQASQKVAILSEYLAYKKSVDIYEETAKKRPLTSQETSELKMLKEKRDEFHHKFESQM
jgi:hypothetical protein